MPTILLLPQSAPLTMTSTETQVKSSLRQGAIIIKATSLACMRVSKNCLVRELHVRDALSATQSISRTTPTTHWDSLRLTFVVMFTVLLVLGLLALIARVAYPDEFNKVGTFSRSETKGLLRTVPPSKFTGYHQDYRACWPNDAAQIPNRPPRGPNKLVLQSPQTSNIILGDGNLVMSPVESIHNPLESRAAATTSRSSDNRGRALAIAQKSGSIGFNIIGLNPDIVKSRVQEPTTEQDPETSKDWPQTQHISSNKPAPEQTNEPRAQTDPCAKYRFAPLVKSLTGLVSVQRATIHTLGVGMSWNGIGDGSRTALPGPPHDMEWLQNVFASQENFRFKYLLDRTATLEAVRQSLEDMHSVAGENDFIVLYFSGHGAENDSFELYDPKSPDDSALLNEAMLNEWVIQFRSKTRRIPVYIIFDFCRPSLVKPKQALDSDVYVIWACSPTESALDLRLKAPDRSLPRSCFLLSLILAVDDVSADPTAPVVGRFTSRMEEFVKVIRGLQCYLHKCRRPAPWRCCKCENCLGGNHCLHKNHVGNLPFQVVSIGGIDGNSDLSAVVRYIARHFPLHIKKAADQVAKDHWILYFNPSRISANKRPLNSRNHRLGMNPAIDNSNMARNMTIPVNLVRF